MEFYAWKNGESVELDEIERQGYIEYVQNKNVGQEIEYIIAHLDGDYVNLEYKVKPIPFEHIRRITGYLSEVHQFNDAKQAELGDRVKHLKGGENNE